MRPSRSSTYHRCVVSGPYSPISPFHRDGTESGCRANSEYSREPAPDSVPGRAEDAHAAVAMTNTAAESLARSGCMIRILMEPARELLLLDFELLVPLAAPILGIDDHDVQRIRSRRKPADIDRAAPTRAMTARYVDEPAADRSDRTAHDALQTGLTGSAHNDVRCVCRTFLQPAHVVIDRERR